MKSLTIEEEKQGLQPNGQEQEFMGRDLRLKAVGMAQVIEYQPSKLEALSSKPSTTIPKRGLKEVKECHVLLWHNETIVCSSEFL
jgi:hypothetical protein